jgi:hypothetical protein
VRAALRARGLDEPVSAMLARFAMRRRVLFITVITLAVLLTGVSPAFAQTDERDTLIGVDLGGPLFGIYSGAFQQLLQNDLSIFVRGVYFDPQWSVVYRDLVPETWTYWSADVEIGANYYPQDSAPAGFFAGVGVAPGYLFLRDSIDEEVTGFQIGVVTQIGYQVLLGPIALAPRLGMGHQWVFVELDLLDDDADIQNENGIAGVVTGFMLSAGLDISIAF